MKKSNQAAKNGGQINFLDKSVHIDIFAKKNENEEIKEIFVIFDEPKKYDRIISIN